jgi:hypothetical protein
MNVDWHAVGIVGVLAIMLLVADRYYRINPFLVREGFQLYGAPQRCGVDLPPCNFPDKCANGFCRGSDTPQLHDRNPLPVLP